jgi:amino acid adenylation domain-containing protein
MMATHTDLFPDPAGSADRAASAGLDPAPYGMHGWFLRGLAADPDAIALRIGPRRYSYRRLYERALALAGDLAAACGRPRRVGLLAARCEQAYAGMLAAGFAGAAVVPLNPEFPAERTRRMVAAAGLDALVTDEAGLALLPALADELGRAPVITEPAGRPLARPVAAAPDDVAYILFTSGSTGRPKGVPVLHRNVCAYLSYVHQRYGFRRDDVFSQTFDLTFDLSVFDLFTAWGCGGTLVCVPPQAFAGLKEFVAHHGITVWFSSPSVISLIGRLRGLAPADLPSLRLSLFCGEPLLRHDAADWQAAAPRSRVENLYGPTELTISCSVYRWDPASTADLCVNDVVPIGVMHPGMWHVLVGPDGRPDPREGELCVTGAQMFPGYLDPADNAGRFAELGGQRWYRTGDMARMLPSGDLAYLGRRDHQVKIRGVRVELAEVEWGLRRCTGVRDAVAVAVGGELVAFYLGDPRPSTALIAELGTFFPRYQIPRLFHHLAEFPLNANRKTDRPALAALAAELTSGARA